MQSNLIMGGRKRITKELVGEVIVDEFAFSRNIGSRNARKVVERSEQVNLEVWYDKHYLNRVQFGEDNGSKREGIDEKTILDLVSRSLRHLIFYSFQVKNFSFVSSNKLKSHNLRVVLQKQTKTGLLNVVVGFCHISNNRYEVTVFTAMVRDTFRISDSQFVILIDENISVLRKMANKRLIELDTNP